MSVGDDLVNSATPENTPTAGEKMVADFQKQKVDALTESHNLGQDIPPDKAIKTLDASAKTGLPPQAIPDDPSKLTRKKLDPKAIEFASPATAELMRKSPQHASAIADDYEKFKDFEQTATHFDKWKEYGTQISDAINGALQQASEHILPLASMATPLAGSPLVDKASEYLSDSFKESQQWLQAREHRATIDQAVEMFANGDYSGALLAVGPMVAQQVVMAPVGFHPLAYAAQSYASSMETRKEDKASGKTELQADADAAIDGMASLVGWKLLGSKAVRGMLGEIVAKHGGNFAVNFAENMFKNVLHSGGLFGAMSAGDEFIHSLGKYATGVDPDAMNGVIKRMTEKFGVGFLTGGGYGAFHGAVKWGEVREKVDAHKGVADAQAASDAFQRLVKNSEDMKLQKLAPEVHQENLQALLGKGTKNTYFPIEKFEELAKSNGMTGSDMAKELGISDSHELSSKNSGIDVKIPTAALLTKLGGTEHLKNIKDIVKFGQNDTNVEDAKARLDAIKQKYKPVEVEKPKTTVDQFKDKFREVMKNLGMELKPEEKQATVAKPPAIKEQPSPPEVALKEAVDKGIVEPPKPLPMNDMLKNATENIKLASKLLEVDNAALKHPDTGNIHEGYDHTAAMMASNSWDGIPHGSYGPDSYGFTLKNGEFITRDETQKRYGFRTSEQLNAMRDKLKLSSPAERKAIELEKIKFQAERDVNGLFKKTTMLLPLGVNKLTKTLGMSESQASHYIKIVSEAGAKAKKEILDKIIWAQEERQSKEWKQEHKQVKEEFAKNDYDKRPEVIARAILETGKMPDGSKPPEEVPIKDLTNIKFPKDGEDQPDIHPALKTKDSLELDRLSEYLGYKDSGDMLNAVSKTGERENVLNDYADQHMMATHDNTVEVHQDQIESAVLNASMRAALRLQSEYLASDHFAKFMGLARRLITVTRSDDAVTHEASKQLDQISAEDISPTTHILGFLKNQKDSLKALEKGDIPEAIRQNEQARVNMEMHSLALKAKKDLNWLDKTSRILAKTKTRERLGMAGNGEVAILDKFRNVYSLPGNWETEELKKTLGEWSKVAVNGDGEPIIIPQEVIDRIDSGKPVKYKELPWGEVSGMIDSIKQIKKMATDWNTIYKGDQKIEIDGVVKEFQAQHKDGFPDAYDDKGVLKKEVAGSKTLKQILGRALGNVRLNSIKPEAFAEKIDNDQYGGWFQKNIFERMSGSTAKKVDFDDNFQRSMKEAMSESGYNRQARADAMVLGGKLSSHYSKELDTSDGGGDFQPHNGHLTRDEEFGILHLMGHSDGIDKLCKGYGWTKEGLHSFVKNRFSSKELQLAQKNWDYLKSLREPYEKELSDLVGLKPKWIPGDQITVETNDGKTVKLDGGYFPLKAEGDFSNQKYDAKKSLGEQLTGAFKSAMPKSTQLEKRVEHTIPPSLEWAESLSHYVNAAHHDISARRSVVDMHKLISRPEVRDILNSIGGPDAAKYVDELIYDFATQNRQYPKTMSERLVRVARNNVTTVATGFKSTVGLAHFGSLFSAAMELGREPRADRSALGRFFAPFGGVSKIAKEYYNNFFSNTVEVAKGLGKDGYVRRMAEAHQDLFEKPEKFGSAFEKAVNDSDMMRQRLSGHTTDIDISNTERTMADVIGSGAGIKEFVGARLRIPEIRRAASIIIRYADAVNSLVTYSVAYQDAMAGELKNFAMGDHDGAVKYAESVVRKTKGSNNVEDLAPNQRVKNEWAKTFVMFLNPQMTQIEGVIKRARKQSNVAKLIEQHGVVGASGMLSASLFVGVMAPAIYEALVHGHTPKKNDDDQGAAGYAAESTANYLSSGSKWGRVGVNAIEQLMKTKEGGFPDLTRLNPIAGAAQTSFNATHALTKDDEMNDKDQADVAQFMEYLAGSPTEMARKLMFPGAER